MNIVYLVCYIFSLFFSSWKGNVVLGIFCVSAIIGNCIFETWRMIYTFQIRMPYKSHFVQYRGWSFFIKKTTACTYVWWMRILWECCYMNVYKWRWKVISQRTSLTPLTIALIVILRGPSTVLPSSVGPQEALYMWISCGICPMALASIRSVINGWSSMRRPVIQSKGD